MITPISFCIKLIVMMDVEINCNDGALREYSLAKSQGFKRLINIGETFANKNQSLILQRRETWYTWDSRANTSRNWTQILMAILKQSIQQSMLANL